MAEVGSGEAGLPCVALRADIDALPILEETDVPFQSKVGGCYGVGWLVSRSIGVFRGWSVGRLVGMTWRCACFWFVTKEER